MLALIPPVCCIGALAFHRSLPLPLLLRDPRLRRAPPLARSLMAFSTDPAAVEEKVEAEDEDLPTAVAGGGDWCDVSHEEWRRWGTSSTLPAAVAGVIHELLEMEAAAGEKMRFGGVGSKLKVTSSSSLIVLFITIYQPSDFLDSSGFRASAAGVELMHLGLISSGFCRAISRTWRTRSTGLSTRGSPTPTRSCSTFLRGRLAAVC